MRPLPPRFCLIRCRAPVVMYLLAVTALVGCDRSPAPARGAAALREGIRVIILGSGNADPRWPGVQGGAQRYAAVIPDIIVECLTPPAGTAESFRSTLTTVLDRRPQAVCLYVSRADWAEPTLLTEALDRLTRAQILIVAVGEPFPDPRVYGQVGVDWPEAAGRLGDDLPRIEAGKRSYLVLHADGANAVATNCYRRFITAARRQTELTLLQERNQFGADSAPPQLVEQMLDLFPHAGLLVTLDPTIWLNPRPGWTRQLRERFPGFRFVTLSAAPVLWKYLGTQLAPGDAAALLGPLDGELGYAAVKLAVDALVGEREDNPHRWVLCELVTPQNLLDFARRYSESANGLDVSSYLRDAAPLGPKPPGG